MGLRNEALLAGAMTYFTGKQCLHGHLAKRRTVNGACTECEKGKKGQALKEWRKKNPEKNTIQRKRQAEEYREKLNSCPKYREETRTQVRQNAKKWREENKGKKNADTAKRHAAKLQRIPKWLTADEKERTACYYQLAAMRTMESGHDWHVDHIVPMRGESVSGLHVPWNLRVIPAQENMSKGNRYGNFVDASPLAS